VKLLLSADIEGTAGIATWEETTKGNAEYAYFRQLMTEEVCAACRGALASKKVTELLVRDAHGSACNLLPDRLPKEVKILRAWAGEPAGMVSGLSEGFDALAMTGYHSAAYTDGNPLAHTMNTQNQFIRINGELASEFLINAYAAALHGTAVIFVSGDEAVCESAKALCPTIVTAPVCRAFGGASLSVQPVQAREKIYEGMLEAVSRSDNWKPVPLPKHFSVEVEFRSYAKAHRGSFYPGAKAIGKMGLGFESDDFDQVLRFLLFTL
jgi:D-amino peptidase